MIKASEYRETKEYMSELFHTYRLLFQHSGDVTIDDVARAIACIEGTESRFDAMARRRSAEYLRYLNRAIEILETSVMSAIERSHERERKRERKMPASIKGYRITKDGKVKKAKPRMAVSKQRHIAKSKRQRVVSRAKAAGIKG